MHWLAWASGTAVACTLAAAIGRALLQRRWRSHEARLCEWVDGLDDVHSTPNAAPAGAMPRLSTALTRHAAALQTLRQQQQEWQRTSTADTLASLQQADAAVRAKDRFLDAVNHDLRQPVQSMGLALARLRSSHATGAQREDFDRLAAGLDGITRLLDDWLQLSRLDAGDVQPAVVTCLLQAVFDAALQRHADAAQQAGVRLLARARGKAVLADPGLLATLLDPLLDNAIKAASAGGCILLTARDRGARVRIDVRDNGIGIAPVHHERVFEPFFQLGNSERDQRKGLGLGLAIASRLAALMGTRIQLRSRLHGGSCFHIDLPRAMAPMPSRAIVMDADAARRATLAGLLQSWGYAVQAEGDPQSAITCLQASQSMAAVVCDVDGEHDGAWEVLAQAAILQPGCRRAVVCSAPSPAMQARAHQAGAALVSGTLTAPKLRALLASDRRSPTALPSAA